MNCSSRDQHIYSTEQSWLVQDTELAIRTLLASTGMIARVTTLQHDHVIALQ
jgi:hypothetical protein